jgi:hypothetical protein
MNERIKELHNLACRIDMEQHPDAIPDGERIQQKFAELIVKECVAIANRQFSAATGLDDRDCLTAQQMKQHFGVEL